jgi:signal transduction histidine kinase
VLAIAIPPLVSFMIAVRSTPRLDYLTVIVLLSAAGFVVGHLWRSAPRALRLVLLLALPGATALAAVLTSGLAPGAMGLVGMCATFAATFLGRRSLVAVLLGVPVLLIGAGWLVVKGTVTLRQDDLDPMHMENWVRVGVVMSVLATAPALLVSGILAELARSRDLLALLNQRLLEAKEEERRSLARELHDQLGQMLTALKLQLLARGAADAGPVALVDDLIARTRKLCVDLRPPLFDELGLLPALAAHAEAQGELLGLPIELDLGDLGGGLDAERELALFRVAQEALTNVGRHAGAKRVSLRLRREGDTITLEVSDDGRGFDPGEARRRAVEGAHLGLVGAGERLRALGGVLMIDARPGHGTRLVAVLPAAGDLAASPAA